MAGLFVRVAGFNFVESGNSVKLVLMRWRIGLAAGGVGLAFLLVLACHPGFTVGAPAGMSAPRVPAASIESAPAAQLLQSPFDQHGLVLRVLRFSLALVAVCTRSGARQDAGTIPP